MKHNIKYVISLVFMFLMTQGAWADPTVTIIKQLNGTTVTTPSPGDVTPEIANGKCTLTVIPAQGNYVTKDFITVYSVVTGDVAQAPRRTPNLDNTPIEVTPNDANADPTGETHYTFAMPNDGSDVEVTVNFQSMVMYDLFIGETQVTELNASDVLKNGKVSFTPASESDNNVNTLTLNDATLTVPLKVGLPTLTLDIQGANTITTEETCIQKKANTTPNVTFKSTSDIVGSLTLKNTSTESTTGVNNVGENNEGSFSISNELTLILKKDGYVYSNDYYFTDGSTKEAVLAPAFGIMIGELPVNIGNADDVRGDGKISFNNESSTLTLNGATINSGSNYAFVMGDNMTALNVVLVGENTVAGNGFQFTSSSASLTFKTNGTAAGSLTIVDTQDANYSLASIGTTINYQNELVYDAETKTVGALSAPIISSILNGSTGERTVEIQGQSQGTVKYSLTYADTKLSTKNVSNQEYSEAFPLLGPATIKATVTVGEVVSPEATAYYFGILPNPLKFVYDGQTAPAFTATLYPNVDGVSFTPSGSPGDFVTLSDGNMTITGFGSGKASALINAPETRNFIVLADTIGFMMEVVPPAPTIAFDETKTYLNSDKVNISLPVSLQNDVNATIKYSWVETCKPENGDNYDSDSKVELNAGTNTLYAWVRHNGATADDAVYSERVSQTFTVKTDINQYAVKDLIASELTYTGTTIVPSFTLYDPKDETNTISTDNYDVKIEKNTGDGYSVVQSVKDAGEYMISAVAKGNTYGGEKIIYESLEVSKADLQGLPTVASDDLEYNGKEQVLLPITVPDEVTVEYFFTSITKEDYNDGSYDPNCAGEVTYSTNIPKATNAGYFAIIYKVNGGNNYNNILPSGTIKVAILPAAITEVTLSENTKEYNGQAQTVTITSVKAGTMNLTANDYTVSYEMVDENEEPVQVDAPVETATYHVVVTGKGNFTGTKSATFTIVNRTLADGEVTFHEGWATYCSLIGDVNLPAGIGAYVASGLGNGVVSLTQISYIPAKEPVLLNNATTTTTDNTEYPFNLLQYAGEDIDVDDMYYYGLHNGAFMRVTGTIPEGKIYLYAEEPNAPQLTIVIDDEATGISEIETMRNVDNENVYDLMGRKVQKPSKKGLYISKGHKVVINK